VPLVYRVLGTVAVVLLVAGVLGFRWLRARARAKALEREILKQSERQASQVRPEKRAEIFELSRQISQGIKALQQTKLGARYGRSALYALPWYAIIGPPGCGKTTALRHSGLNFPVSDARGAGAVKGVGGTRNCDWWFTNEAILLDTAGRYSVEDDDRDEWLGFLDLLKKHRPRKPLNGLLVSVAVSDLISANEEQVVAMATKLRARVDEIMSRLEMVLPVYLVLTKADLLAGFIESFSGLRKSERDQILGASFPLESAMGGDPASLFVTEFDRLTTVLHARAIRVMTDERHPLARQRIFQFPIEFKALRNNLEELVRIVFAPNTFQESPLFRGFYFTSGTQEGRPIDRVIGGMAKAFGLRTAEQAEEPREPKSYFVTDLFRKVVFPDQHLAGATEAALRRRLLTSIAIGATLAVAGAILVIPGLFTFGNNRELVAQVRASALGAETVKWPANALQPADVPKVDDLRTHLVTLSDWNADGAPARYRWGMYTGEVLYTPARDAFVGMHEEHVAHPVQAILRGMLDQLQAGATLPPDQFKRYYDSLKLYLMMGTPERIDDAWASTRLQQMWTKAAPQASAVQKDMGGNLLHYVRLVHRREAPAWKLDEPVVAKARTVLLRAPRLERLYEVLVQGANDEIGAIKRQDIFYGSVASFVISRKEKVVEGAYTKEGWARIRKLLTAQQSRLADEGWVLGQERELATGELNKQISDLRTLYFSRFTQTWVDFLSDMEVHQPENAEVALEELQALSEPLWPYQRLIKTLADNVTLDVSEEDETSVADGIVDRVKAAAEKKLVEKKLMDAGAPEPTKQRPVSPVERAFQPMIAFAIPPEGSKGEAPTGLGQYQQLLAKLVGVLTDLKDSDGGPDTTKLSNEFEQAFRAATSLLTTQDGFTRPILTPYLMRPITGAWRGVVKDAGGAASGLWETTAWDKWHTTLEGRYPFVDSPKDAKIEDFTEFFQPENGQLWAFYRDNLTGSLRHSGDLFLPVRRFQSSSTFVPDFLSNCLERGAKIAHAVFPAKSPTPNLKFEVNLHSVSPDVAEVQIEIDGTAKTYKNTPERWLTTEWPAKEAKSKGARVRIRGYSGLDEQIIREGDFGIFRLLDAADDIQVDKAASDPDGAPALVATWTLRSQGEFFKLDVRASRADGLPDTALFRGYKCPRVIAVAGD
jgi:type VI secretion system protein ImpL